MVDQKILERCLSDASEIDCVSRIDSYLPIPDLLLSACFLFMSIAAIGSVIELSSKRPDIGGFLKFASSLTLTTYLVLIPLGGYSLEVFDAPTAIGSNLKSVSWFHHLKELGLKHNT
jgi:hypothetical protein